MSSAEDRARQQGCSVMTLEVFAGDATARGVYARLGYHEQTLKRPSVRARSSNRAPQVGADDVRSARAALDDYATWYAPTVLGGTLDQWAEVATAGQLETWLEQHPHSVIALFSRFATAAAGLHRVGHGSQNLLSGGFLEPCKDRHGRAREVAESICSPRWGFP